MMSWMKSHTQLVLRQDDPELLEQFDGDLEDAGASASASRSCQEARELLARVKSAGGYFPVVGSGAFDGLAQPSTDRKPAKSRGKGKKGKRKENPLLRKVDNGQGCVHLAFCRNHRPHVLSLVLRCPRSVRLQLAQLVVDHITLLVFVLISACSVDKWDIVLQECRNKGKATAFSPGKRAFGTHALGCAGFDSPCYGATIEEIEQDQDEEDIEDFVAFSIQRLEEFAILDGGATKTLSGFMSVQPAADQYEGTTIEMTDVDFTFAGGETEATSTKICIPHAEFPQGISVNVVLNESTPFLVGLDVLREYGLVIDCHYNRACNHILKRYLPCAILAKGHLALEMMPGNSEQHPVASQAPSTRHWGLHSSQGHRRKERFHLNHPYHIFMTKTYRTTSSSGPLWRNVVAQITIDDKTGHITSLRNTKHMTEKDLHRNFALCS